MTAAIEPQHALRREAKRVLRRLAESGGHLRPLDDGRYGLFVRRNNAVRPVLKIASHWVQGFRAEDWLSDCRNCGAPCLGLSAAGAAFLRRSAAPDDDSFAAQHRLYGARYI